MTFPVPDTVEQRTRRLVPFWKKNIEKGFSPLRLAVVLGTCGLWDLIGGQEGG